MFNTIFVVTPADLFGVFVFVVVCVIGIPFIIYKKLTHNRRRKKDLDEWLKSN